MFEVRSQSQRACDGAQGNSESAPIVPAAAKFYAVLGCGTVVVDVKTKIEMNGQRRRFFIGIKIQPKVESSRGVIRTAPMSGENFGFKKTF